MQAWKHFFLPEEIESKIVGDIPGYYPKYSHNLQYWTSKIQGPDIGAEIYNAAIENPNYVLYYITEKPSIRRDIYLLVKLLSLKKKHKYRKLIDQLKENVFNIEDV